MLPDAFRAVGAGPRRLLFLAFLAANLALVWALPILPGHDLPKHLAGVRVLMEAGQPGLIDAYFAPVPGRHGYFAAHYALAALGRVLGLMAALRLLYSLYVAGTLLGFDGLVRAVRPRERPAAGPPWTSFLGVLLVWNPAVLFGFLPFMLAIPCFLAAAALLIRAGRAGAPRDYLLAALGSLPAAFLHPAAGAAILWLAVLLALGRRTAAQRRASLLVGGAVLLVTVALAVASAQAQGTLAQPDWRTAVRESEGLAVVGRYFGLKWASPLVTLDYAIWTVLGPHRAGGLLLNAGVLAGAALVVVRARGGAGEDAGGRVEPGLRRAVVWFTLSLLLCPFGLSRPALFQYLSFRLMTLAFALLLAILDPRWFAPRRAHLALVGALALALGHFSVRGWGYGREAGQALGLMHRAAPAGVLQSVSFHRRSAHFARVYHLTMDLPLYYTILDGGIAAQYQGEYLLSTVVRYRPGKQPYNFNLAAPWEFFPGQLAGADYVLLERPTEEDRADYLQAAPEVERKLREAADLVGCEGLWCLYQVRR